MAQTAALVEAAGRWVYTRMTDVADPNSVRRWWIGGRGVRPGGCVINNAGVGTAVPATRETPGAVPRSGRRQPARLVLDGAGLCAGDAAGQCDRQRLQHPRADHRRPPQAAYSASQGRCAGPDPRPGPAVGARKGIRVNALAPGFFKSEMTDEYKPGYSRQPAAADRKLGRIGDPAELVADGGVAGLAGGWLCHRPDDRRRRRADHHLSRCWPPRADACRQSSDHHPYPLTSPAQP